MATPDIYTRKVIDVLDPELETKLRQYYILRAFEQCGCTRGDGFEGQGVIPIADMERVSVFKTSVEKGTYNHHSCLTKWKGRYWFAWDNCHVNEEWPGQKTMLAWSDDARKWSEPIIVADGDREAGMLRNIGALYAGKDKLYAFIQEKWDLVHATNPGMSIHDNTQVSYRFDLHESEDGIHWKAAREGHFDLQWTLEAPRLTKEGRLLGPATTHDLKPAALLWPGDDPEEKPEVIPFPYTDNIHDYYNGQDEGLYLYGEASWYQDDDGRIWMWHRDESGSCRLGVALSEDGGRSWTNVIRSNFPDSMSRVHAGRLTDGRFYLVGNQTFMFMDRNFFAVSLSDDGAKFNKTYQLVRERTQQRFPGHLKGHGYQYPSCLVDGDNLLIGYSVNKEDIEVGILDVTKL